MANHADLERLALGADAWNSWADERCRERAALESEGHWAVGYDGTALNEASRQWLVASSVDFSGHEFADTARFDGIVFPGPALFDRSVFRAEARFAQARFCHASASDVDVGASFREAKFRGPLRAEGATFCGESNFARAEFDDDARFSDCTFKQATQFWRARFNGDARFGGVAFQGIARFVKASFAGVTQQFSGATFAQDAQFWEAEFDGDAQFWRARFASSALFIECVFQQKVRFSEAHLNGTADFSKSTFNGPAQFLSVTIGEAGQAIFRDCAFAKDANFLQGRFDGPVYFDNADFRGDAILRSVKSSATISIPRAYFHVIPDFREARLDHPLEFGVGPERPTFGSGRPAKLPSAETGQEDSNGRSVGILRPSGANAALASRLRVLRQIAEQGDDHWIEMEFFASEVKARRLSVDTILGPGAFNFAFGHLYEWVSDFGRSTVRPLLLWLVVQAVFFAIYASTAVVLADSHRMPGALPARASEALAALSRPCLSGSSSVSNEALYLTLARGTVVGAISDDRLDASLECLRSRPVSTGSGRTVSIQTGLAGLAHVLLSSISLFLLALGIRNNFRIR